MALLLVAVVMNLLWVAARAAFVVVEKGLPRGEFVGRGAGGCSSWLASVDDDINAIRGSALR
jgi:predicted metal-binding membrane protein